MSKKNTIGLVLLGVVLVAGSFYAGTAYGKGKASVAATSGRGGFSQAGGARGGFGGGGSVLGQIIAKDATSITVALRTGGAAGSSATAATGTKIVFYTDQTPVVKTVNGTPDDLAVGTQVVIMGSANSDGSVTASSIQVRPSAN